MVEWLAGGAIGAVVAALGVGIVLWRERGKRADAELAQSRLELQLATAQVESTSARALVSVLRVVSDRKEERIRELENQLAEIDPGRLLDDLFGGLPEDTAADTPSTK